MENREVYTAETGPVVTEADVLDEILVAHGHVAPPAGSFTVRDYVSRAGGQGVTISEHTARAVLRQAVEAGRLNGGKFRIDGRQRWAFWQ